MFHPILHQPFHTECCKNIDRSHRNRFHYCTLGQNKELKKMLMNVWGRNFLAQSAVHLSVDNHGRSCNWPIEDHFRCQIGRKTQPEEYPTSPLHNIAWNNSVISSQSTTHTEDTMQTKQKNIGEVIKTKLKFVNKLRNPLLKNQTKNTKLKKWNWIGIELPDWRNDGTTNMEEINSTARRPQKSTMS
jgi:hypothetical protein